MPSADAFRLRDALWPHKMQNMVKLFVAVALLAFVQVWPLTAHAQPSDDPYAVHGYDPRRDPKADISAASVRATKEGKRILVIAGGDWCVWCKILDRALAQDSEVMAEVAQTFVIVDVNMSRENTNSGFFRNYRKAPGYPDFLILESDGSFLGAQDTSKLERGDGYNRKSLIAFARRWRS
ncbi:MAG TPA: thioredoxin family protein [Caulobacterales bacterium]|jgi:thiol:disulfide interchange protein|nr:thioredoxin family protein [Caulobacterales bacterium]